MSKSPEVLAGEPRGHAARRAGVLLLLTAAMTMATVYARVAAEADQPTLLESLQAIAANKAMYSTAGAARILSGIALVAVAWQVWRVTVIRERLGTPLVPYLFVASGVLTAASGVCALVLAVSVGEASDVAVSGTTETISSLRWITGKLGFTTAGLALGALGLSQWKAARMIAAASALIGAGMLLIWVDAATIVHRISGVAFFVWLVVIGIMLVAGRVERPFSAMRQST